MVAYNLQLSRKDLDDHLEEHEKGISVAHFALIEGPLRDCIVCLVLEA